jgi:hypothetical protein
MKISKMALLKTAVAGSVTLGLLGINSPAEAAYDATFYVAGMGGHFAKAEVTIDPSKEKSPFTMKKLDKVDIGTRATHPVHDARIDHNTNTMFWSTYQADASPEFANIQAARVGQTDLKTDGVLQDMLISIPSEATKTKALYCASGQTKDYFIPISMANKGYIDIIQKSDMKLVQRVFLEGTAADIGKPYKFYHGTTTPDEKRLLITVNEAETDHGKLVGKMHFIELDVEALVKGEVKVMNKGLATAPGTFVSFRQYYSPDGKYIANSGGGYMLLMDAKTLTPIDVQPMPNLTENHDAMFTPDSKYVIATSRTKAPTADCKDPSNPGPDEFIMDGELLLYDVAAQKFVGDAVKVCSPCHQAEGVEQHAILCGLEAVWM